MSKSFVQCDSSGVQYRIARETAGEKRDEVCSFDISLLNPRCMGRGLQCLLAWANDGFKSFEFSLADTLYMHSFSAIAEPGKDPLTVAQASDRARELGDRWIETNHPIIESFLGKEFTIRRWDEWKQHDEFNDAVSRVQELFSLPSLRPLVIADASAFFKRKNTEKAPSEVQISALVDFIVEESAVYFIHSKHFNVRHVYPGKSLAVLRKLANSALEDRTVDKEVYETFREMKRTDIDMRL